MELSILIPFYNEEKNVDLLYRSLKEALREIKKSYEIIFIDDGSTDKTPFEVEKVAKKDNKVRALILRRNYGQTAALSAGFDESRGKIIITLDGDLQNDPKDIPRLLLKVNEGFDVVSGWRRNRKEPFLTRCFPSKIANFFVSKIGGVKLHDTGCTLKAYKKDILKGINLYGEMHRFIPIYATWQGAKICEIPVKDHPRKFGRSKYNLSRIFKVLLDLIVIKFLERYSQKPIYIFGGFGILSFLGAIVSFGLAIYYKFWGGKSFIETPLPQVTVMFLLISFLSVFLGLLAEMVIRTYYESQEKPTYQIKYQIPKIKNQK